MKKLLTTLALTASCALVPSSGYAMENETDGVTLFDTKGNIVKHYTPQQVLSTSNENLGLFDPYTSSSKEFDFTKATVSSVHGTCGTSYYDYETPYNFTRVFLTSTNPNCEITIRDTSHVDFSGHIKEAFSLTVENCQKVKLGFMPQYPLFGDEYPLKTLDIKVIGGNVEWKSVESLIGCTLEFKHKVKINLRGSLFAAQEVTDFLTKYRQGETVVTVYSSVNQIHKVFQ